MKKIIWLLLSLLILLPASKVQAAGVYASGNRSAYVGDNVSVSITASGADFNAFSGTIGVSGPLRVVSTTAGDALWVTKPAGAGSFAGALTNSTNSFRVATLVVRGTDVGTGHVTVSGVKLANRGPIVGTDGGSLSISFERRPTPPGTVTVASATHPDQNVAYEAPTITLNWDKPSGVTGFSYLLDQTAETVPAAAVTDANMTKTYENQAIGTHYFHIRALNGDGWGPSTHFKITIKEPDPKVQETLNKPHDLVVSKATKFTNNVVDGLFTGIVITGITEPGFMANIKLDPIPDLPENKVMSAKADATGHFEYTIDFPIPAGFYKLTVQGQNNKILTPESKVVPFEISQAKGGTVTMLTKTDEKEPVIPEKKWHEKINYIKVSIVATALFLLTLLALVAVIIFPRLKKRYQWKIPSFRL